jgi:hypothetical protein
MDQKDAAMDPQVTTQDSTITSRWYVRSSQDVAKFYEVAEDRGFLRCSCPAAIYRPTRPCRHIRAVLAGDALVAKRKVSPGATLSSVLPTFTRARVGDPNLTAALEV